MDSENVSKDITSELNDMSHHQRHGVDISPDRDKGVLKETLRQGTGDERPLKGDIVYLHYIGRLQEGTEFDSSRRSNEKCQFVLDEDGSMSTALLCLSWALSISASSWFLKPWFHFRFRFISCIGCNGVK